MPETFVHSQPVREARRRRRHLSAPTAGSCRQTCYCKTLKRCTGSWARARGRGGGLKAPQHHPPAGEGPGPQLSILRVGGPLLVPGEGLLDGSGHLVPISGVWLGAAQHLPSNPSSDFARHGRAGILGPRGVFWASLPKEIAVWQWVLVQGQGSQAVGLLPSCPAVSAINTMCSSSLYG